MKLERKYLLQNIGKFKVSKLQVTFLRETQLPFNIIKLIYQTRYFMADGEARGRIFSQVLPFYERAESDLVSSMHRSLWV
jgi:hypothetical protein